MSPSKDTLISSIPYAAIVGILVAMSWDAVSNMIALWLTTDTYMHGALVLPLAFILARGMPLPNVLPSTLPRVQSLFLVLLWSVGIVFAQLVMINSIQQFMLLSTIPLIVVLCYGWAFARHYAAPLALVFLAIPLGDFLVPSLQSITADLAVFFLQWSGVSVVRNGWYLSISAADFRVAEACSGINFLISTFTVSVFYAFFYMEKPSKRFAFIMMGLLVPLVANGLRVYLIIMIAHWGNVEAATGFDHLVYGWIFFVVILAALFAIGSWLQDPPKGPSETGIIIDSSPLSWKSNNRPFWVMGAAILAATYMFWHHSKLLSSQDFIVHGDAVAEGDLLSPHYPFADYLVVKTLPSGWRQYHASYLIERHDKKMISYINRWFDGHRWSIESRRDNLLESGTPVTHYRLVNLQGQRYSLVVSHCIAGEWYSRDLNTKFAQMFAQLQGTDFGGQAFAWFAPAETSLASLPGANELSMLCNNQQGR